MNGTVGCDHQMHDWLPQAPLAAADYSGDIRDDSAYISGFVNNLTASFCRPAQRRRLPPDVDPLGVIFAGLLIHREHLSAEAAAAPA